MVAAATVVVVVNFVAAVDGAATILLSLLTVVAKTPLPLLPLPVAAAEDYHRC